MQLMCNRTRSRLKRPAHRGYALLVALALVVALLIFVAGTQRTMVQHLALTRTERDSERALEMAEVGLNKLLYSLSNPAIAQPTIYNFGTGIPSIPTFKTGVRAGTYVVTLSVDQVIFRASG